MAAWGDGGVCITLSFSNKLQCGYPDRHEWLYGDTGIAPWGVVAGDGQVWVLTRGEDNVEEAMVIAYAPRGDHLERLAAWKLRGIPGLWLPRSLVYDATTRTLLVRGMGSVIAIPVVD